MSEWQPIETAPKDGRFLVFLSDGAVEVAKRIPNSKTMVIGGAFSFDRSEKPTHWMPLPEPPHIAPMADDPITGTTVA
jgi:hypothetical protein